MCNVRPPHLYSFPWPLTTEALDVHNRSSGIFSEAFPQGYFGRERPPQGVWRRCKLRHTPAPAPGRKRGGVAPVHLRFPRAAPPSREAIRNPNGDSRLEKSRRARRRALIVHMPRVVSCALPDRHGTPLFSGQDRPSRKSARTPYHEACREDDHGGGDEKQGQKRAQDRMPRPDRVKGLSRNVFMGIVLLASVAGRIGSEPVPSGPPSGDQSKNAKSSVLWNGNR